MPEQLPEAKIYICMEGGIVQNVGTVNLPNCQIIIIDHDTPKEEPEDSSWMETYKERIAELEKDETAGLILWQY